MYSHIETNLDDTPQRSYSLFENEQCRKQECYILLRQYIEAPTDANRNRILVNANIKKKTVNERTYSHPIELMLYCSLYGTYLNFIPFGPILIVADLYLHLRCR